MFKAIILFSGPCRDDIRRCIPTTITKTIGKNIHPEYQLIAYPQTPPNDSTPSDDSSSPTSDSNVTNVSSYSVTCLPSLKSHLSVKRCIIDTGASVSATSETHALSDLHPCTNLTAYPAFGPPIIPKQRGTYGPLIDNMPDTLLSVSQICMAFPCP
jgi:hypothetical protein